MVNVLFLFKYILINGNRLISIVIIDKDIFKENIFDLIRFF